LTNFLVLLSAVFLTLLHPLWLLSLPKSSPVPVPFIVPATTASAQSPLIGFLSHSLPWQCHCCSCHGFCCSSVFLSHSFARPCRCSSYTTTSPLVTFPVSAPPPATAAAAVSLSLLPPLLLHLLELLLFPHLSVFLSHYFPASCIAPVIMSATGNPFISFPVSVSAPASIAAAPFTPIDFPAHFPPRLCYYSTNHRCCTCPF
jgi:hypothetical protein